MMVFLCELSTGDGGEATWLIISRSEVGNHKKKKTAKLKLKQQVYFVPAN